MCEACARDLYAVCADCHTLMPIDEWGTCCECITDSEHVDRCQQCHNRIYDRCNYCGRYVRHNDNTLHVHPHNGSTLCAQCYDSLFFECPNCHVVKSESHKCYTDDGCLCKSCFDEKYILCRQCGGTYRRAGFEGDIDDSLCNSCYDRVETWNVRTWAGQADQYSRIGSRRRFGVELETASYNNHRQLHRTTQWGCVYECSTPGLEFVSPILQGDAGLAEIASMCRYARLNRWSVDRSCGLHIHLDLSRDTSEECLHIAYAYRKTYAMWKKFITRKRSENSMCGSPQYELTDIINSDHIDTFAEMRDRFEFVNWRSYLRHGSLEVRMYQGTLGSREICNWIKLHSRFMDVVKLFSFNELDEIFGRSTLTNWKGMWDLIKDNDLMDYWWRKCRNTVTGSGTVFPKLDENGDWETTSSLRARRAREQSA